MTDGLGMSAASMTPRIYSGSELGVLAITAPDEAHPFVQFVGGQVFVGLNHAGNGKAVTRGEVMTWTRAFPEVIAEAVPTAPVPPDPIDGVRIIEDEALATAVLTNPQLLGAVSDHGAPVLFVLSRECVAVVGADDEAGVAKVLDLVEQLYEADGPLVSAHPLTPAEGGWERFDWRKQFPALEMRFERALRLFNVRAYEHQGRTLKRADVHYADPKIHVLETGVTTTFAAWPQGTATLLPVVDNVFVASPSGAISVTTFGEFLEAGGDAIVRTGLSPLRYFVPGAAPR